MQAVKELGDYLNAVAKGRKFHKGTKQAEPATKSKRKNGTEIRWQENLHMKRAS